MAKIRCESRGPIEIFCVIESIPYRVELTLPLSLLQAQFRLFDGVCNTMDCVDDECAVIVNWIGDFGVTFGSIEAHKMQHFRCVI